MGVEGGGGGWIWRLWLGFWGGGEGEGGGDGWVWVIGEWGVGSWCGVVWYCWLAFYFRAVNETYNDVCTLSAKRVCY